MLVAPARRLGAARLVGPARLVRGTGLVAALPLATARLVASAILVASAVLVATARLVASARLIAPATAEAATLAIAAAPAVARTEAGAIAFTGGIGLAGALGLEQALPARLLRHRLAQQVGDDPLAARILHQVAGEQGPLRRDQLGEQTAHVIELQLAARGLQILGGRQVALAERDRRILQLEIVEVAELVGRDEADRLARATRTTGAAGAVHVALGVLRERVVDDVADVRDVDATARDVGRDQEAQPTLAHPPEHALARGLGEIGAERLGGEALALQHRRHHVHFFARVAEHEPDRRLLGRDHVEQVAGLHRARARVVRVVDLGGRDRVARELERDRLSHVATGDALDLARHRGREQRGLTVLRTRVEDRVDILEEAHREHLVGLVEHHHAHARQIERATADVIEDAAGRADHGVHAGAQRIQLRLHRGAAVDGQGQHVRVGGQAHELVAHLLRELARGHERDHLDAGLRGVLGLEARREPRQTERTGLAGAGLRLHEHVLAGRDRIEGDDLHAGRLGPAGGRDRGAQRVGQLEAVERRRQRQRHQVVGGRLLARRGAARRRRVVGGLVGGSVVRCRLEGVGGSVVRCGLGGGSVVRCGCGLGRSGTRLALRGLGNGWPRVCEEIVDVGGLSRCGGRNVRGLGRAHAIRRVRAGVLGIRHDGGS